ncbi:hypothetical protein CUMW_036450, partial [Citrus unshiu]
MDAEASVSLLIVKLKTLFPAADEGATISSWTQKRVLKAIESLQLLIKNKKPCLDSSAGGEAADDEARFMQAFYSAQDAINSLAIREEVCQMWRIDPVWVTILTVTTFPFSSFENLRLRSLFSFGMNKFKRELEIRGSSSSSFSYEHQQQLVEVNDTGPSLSPYQGGYSTHRSQQQRWARISDYFCAEDETDVLGLERQVKELLHVLIPEHHGINDADVSTKKIVDGYEYARSSGEEITELPIPEQEGGGDALSNEEEESGRCQSSRTTTTTTTQVIALIGKAGSGKTTLARIVYNRVDVKRHFTKRAWVHIPIMSMVEDRDVLADILKQIDESLLKVEATLSAEELMWRITQALDDSTFLIVMENAEHQKSQVWDSFLGKLCSFTQCGKIIITTSSTEDFVEPLGAAFSTLHVPGLDKNESWELFLKKARIAEDVLQSRSSELIKLKKQILNICDGLPLRVVLLAGLLSTKQPSYEEWSKVIERANGDNLVALCYQDLPAQVKPCILYMGLFPREYEIPVRRLIHLWCAEGFAPPDLDLIASEEDLAEMYLEELVTRHMIQVIRWRLDGSPKTRIRGTPAKQIGIILGKCISKRRLGMLKVLDLEGVYKPMLTNNNALGRLPFLEYLGLRSTFIDSLPDSTPILFCLATLDVSHTKVQRLPYAFWPSRHLYLNWIFLATNVFRHPQFVKWETSLQTLWGLCIKADEVQSLDYFRRLTSLRKLGLKCSSTTSTSLKKEIIGSVLQLSELHSLKLICETPSYLPLLEMAEHYKLQKLYLSGHLPPNSVIGDRSFPPNVVTLTLSQLRLEYDPMPILGRLRQLKILRLFGGSYMGEEMSCSSGEFPNLLVLKLWKLNRLRQWRIKEGAMPCLRQLEIRSCGYLVPPTGLKHVTSSLREFLLTNMPSTFGSVADIERVLGINVYVRMNQWSSSSQDAFGIEVGRTKIFDKYYSLEAFINKCTCRHEASSASCSLPGPSHAAATAACSHSPVLVACRLVASQLSKSPPKAIHTADVPTF